MNARMLHGILVFYVAAIISRKPKSTFKISCAQNVPKIVFFTQKWTQKRLRGNLHEALFFNGREGGIRTHGGSSPHLISSYLNVDFSLMQIAIPLDMQGFHHPISPYIALFRSHIGCQKAVKFCKQKQRGQRTIRCPLCSLSSYHSATLYITVAPL